MNECIDIKKGENNNVRLKFWPHLLFNMIVMTFFNAILWNYFRRRY